MCATKRVEIQTHRSADSGPGCLKRRNRSYRSDKSYFETRMSRNLNFVGALLLLVIASTSNVSAQASQPIYLQYDGFVKNKDGTYTLSFGYFNMNHVDVRIEPGSDNGFLPGPTDRNQPVVFLKGRHRFVCSMVVPGDFDGKLQWNIRFAG